jgi:hypothetical protein
LAGSGFWRALGISGLAQVVEDQTGVAREALDRRGDRILGAGLESTDGEATQRGDALGAVAGADGAAVLIVPSIARPASLPAYWTFQPSGSWSNASASTPMSVARGTPAIVVSPVFSRPIDSS